MAGTLDLIYLTVTFLVIGGAVAAILFIVNKFSEFTSTTKEKLKSKGYDVSSQGIAVQTQKRFNREDYVDATQRKFVKALEASTISKATGDTVPGSSPQQLKSTLQRHDSDHTVKKSRSGLFHRNSK